MLPTTSEVDVDDTPVDPMDRSDPIEAQLYDELYARVWAAALVTGPQPPDTLDPPMARQLAATSRRWAAALRDDDAERAARVWVTIARALWPTCWAPQEDDDWWRTPLGVVMRHVRDGAVPRRHRAERPSRRWRVPRSSAGERSARGRRVIVGRA